MQSCRQWPMPPSALAAEALADGAPASLPLQPQRWQHLHGWVGGWARRQAMGNVFGDGRLAVRAAGCKGRGQTRRASGGLCLGPLPSTHTPTPAYAPSRRRRSASAARRSNALRCAAPSRCSAISRSLPKVASHSEQRCSAGPATAPAAATAAAAAAAEPSATPPVALGACRFAGRCWSVAPWRMEGRVGGRLMVTSAACNALSQASGSDSRTTQAPLARQAKGAPAARRRLQCSLQSDTISVGALTPAPPLAAHLNSELRNREGSTSTGG